MLFFCKIGKRIPVLLLLYLLVSNICLLSQETSEEKRIDDLIERIKSENRVVDELVQNNLGNLPIGIKKTISGTTVTIAIDSAVITPQGMLINAFTELKFPGTDNIIYFALRGAMITPSGLSSAGPTRLEMLNAVRISFSSQFDLVLPANGRNFIEWDCYGFRSLNLNGIFEFSPEIFIPDDPGSSKLTAEFEINTTDPKNILVSTSISRFRIKGLGDMAFSAREAVIDMSDFINCNGFAMPYEYQAVFGDAPQLWRGFFIKDLSVLLPSTLSKGEKRTEISARDLLIDESGVSGHFSASDILNTDEGSASGWPLSVKTLEFSLVKNRLIAGEMAGSIGVPFLGGDTLDYTAQIISNQNGLDYSFSVAGLPEREFSIPFGGTVKLDRGCLFNIKTVNGKFIPSAILNGRIYISGKSEKIDGLRFEQLYLTSESPFIKGGRFDTSGDANFNLAGFELSVDSISLAFRSGAASLGFNTHMALMNKSDKGVSASTRFYVNAHIESEPESDALIQRQKWVFDGIKTEGVNIKGNVSVFSLEGSVYVYDDHPVYGNGINGSVSFKAGKIIKGPAKAEVWFGRKTDYKYWLAKIDIPTNIPLGAVTLTSIKGGAYSNMERMDLYDPESKYIPVKDAGFGLMAGAGVFVKSADIFNADALFEIAINKTGGVKFIRFSGEGKFFSGKGKKDGLFNMSGNLLMVYDNVNDSFHANMNVCLNVANAIRGVGPDDLLGEVVIHSDPQDWYIFIGRPSSPLGVNVAGLITAQTYFMAGTKIENMPLPPAEVAAIISGINMDFMASERGAASGKGVAFGILFKASAGVGEKKGFVYAYFSAGAGADIMLQNYGTASCAGRSGPIGMNGWYASGQGYAYLTGKIGIRVKKAEFDIMNVAAALLVQAKMPNPSWFRGSIAARYSVLGGLIKGKVNVTVVLGEECVFVTNDDVLNDLKIIGDVIPAEGSDKVDVFAAPQVSFNAVINKELGILSLTDEYIQYRVLLDEFNLEASGKRILPGQITWNNNHDLATLRLKDILPGNETITASVKVHIEKKTSSGWQQLTGEPETKYAKFNTGDQPKSIPESNIAYSYPLKQQYNFYKAETGTGYVKLKSGMSYLFEKQFDGINWSYIAKFSSNSSSYEAPVSYDEDQSMLTFEIPQNLSLNSVNDLSIIRRPSDEGAIDRNLRRTNLLLSAGNKEDTISISQTKVLGAVASENETSLLDMSFRTSIYSTFREKLDNMANWTKLYAIDDRSELSTLMSIPHIMVSMDETFDKYEIEGSDGIPPLVCMEAQKENDWIKTHAYPLVYELYASDGLLLDRNIQTLGLFPARAIYMSNVQSDSYLLSGQNSAPMKGDVYLKYYVPVNIHADYYNLLAKATAKYLNSYLVPSPQAQRLLTQRIQDISRGTYPFRLSYRLPGTNLYTTTRDYVFSY
ncbi:MAG: hypothetical protein ACM3NR_02410 [Methanosarcina sp.]